MNSCTTLPPLPSLSVSSNHLDRSLSMREFKFFRQMFNYCALMCHGFQFNRTIPLWLLMKFTLRSLSSSFSRQHRHKHSPFDRCSVLLFFPTKRMYCLMAVSECVFASYHFPLKWWRKFMRSSVFGMRRAADAHRHRWKGREFKKKCGSCLTECRCTAVCVRRARSIVRTYLNDHSWDYYCFDSRCKSAPEC